MSDTGPDEHRPTDEEREAAAEGGEETPETVADAYETAGKEGVGMRSSEVEP